MVTCKISDYMTISVLPEQSGVTIDVLLEQALKTLCLDELWDKGLFDFKCSSQFYGYVYRYSDIQVKLGYEHNFDKVGICFEFSGSGIDYYREYLATHYVKVTLRDVLKRFVALSELGYKTTASRFDVAFDEIIKKGEQVEPLLDLERVETCLRGGAFVSTFRKADATSSSGVVKSVFTVEPSKIDSDLPFRVLESWDLSSGLKGKTIELGRRRSSSFLRFYDKKAEQAVKGVDVSGYEHWARCEIEFKQHNACSVLLLYAMSKNDKDFAERIRGKIFNLIRFVDLLRTRKYNCTVCDWWVKFLDNVAPYTFVYRYPVHNKYIKSLQYQKQRNAASLAALILCNQGNIKSILVEGFNHATKTTAAIISDYRALRQVPKDDVADYVAEQNERLTGLEFWHQYADGYTDEEFAKYFGWFVDMLVDEFNQSVKELMVGAD